MQLLKTLRSGAAVGFLALPAQAPSLFPAGDSNIFDYSGDNKVLFWLIFNGKTVSNFSSENLSSLSPLATVTNYGNSATVISAALSWAD